MVIFHSYVSLPEGNSCLILPQLAVPTMTVHDHHHFCGVAKAPSRPLKGRPACWLLEPTVSVTWWIINEDIHMDQKMNDMILNTV